MLNLFADDPKCNGMYPTVGDKNIVVFVPRRGHGTIGSVNSMDSPDEYDLMLMDYPIWSRELIQGGNTTNYLDMRDDHGSYLLYLTDYTLSNLIDVRPASGSMYIRSQTEPFNEEMELDHRKIKRWLDHFGLITPGSNGVADWDPIHVSGHGDAQQIGAMVSQIAPRRLVPIHTESPKLFKSIHGSVTQVGLGQTIEI